MVGTGIFTASGFLAADLGDPQLVLLIWVAGAICALAGAFCYSELGVNFPSSGGEYVYLTRTFGPTWGFMSGWVSFFAGFAAPIAATALACQSRNFELHGGNFTRRSPRRAIIAISLPLRCADGFEPGTGGSRSWQG